MPGEDAVALPLVRRLGERTGAGNPAPADVEPVASQTPTRNLGHRFLRAIGCEHDPPTPPGEGQRTPAAQVARGALAAPAGQRASSTMNQEAPAAQELRASKGARSGAPPLPLASRTQRERRSESRSASPSAAGPMPTRSPRSGRPGSGAAISQPSSVPQLWIRVKLVPHLLGSANSLSAWRRSEASSSPLNVSSSRDSSATLN
jgi:hypothetical protein